MTILQSTSLLIFFLFWNLAPASTDDEAAMLQVKVPKTSGTYTVSVQALNKAIKDEAAMEPITMPLRNVRDTHYMLGVAIGNPPQRFELEIDTGSGALWVFGSKCKEKRNEGYDSSKSLTSHAKSEKELCLTYASGGVNGIPVSDSVQFGSSTAPDFLFLTSTGLVGNMIGSPPWADGMIGIQPPWAKPNMASSLADPNGPGQPMPGLFTTLNLDPFYALDLATDGKPGVLTVGGVKESLFTGVITYIPAIRTGPWAEHWAASVEGIRCGSVSSGDFCKEHSCDATIDNGAAVIYMGMPNTDETKKLADELGIDLDPRQHDVDCSKVSSMPSVTFILGGKEFPLGPEYYVSKHKKEDGGMRCHVEIMFLNLGEIHTGGYPIMLGAPFMRKYYTVFDGKASRVGFAAKHSSTRPDGDWSW